MEIVSLNFPLRKQLWKWQGEGKNVYTITNVFSSHG